MSLSKLNSKKVRLKFYIVSLTTYYPANYNTLPIKLQRRYHKCIFGQLYKVCGKKGHALQLGTFILCVSLPLQYLSSQIYNIVFFFSFSSTLDLSFVMLSKFRLAQRVEITSNTVNQEATLSSLKPPQSCEILWTESMSSAPRRTSLARLVRNQVL